MDCDILFGDFLIVSCVLFRMRPREGRRGRGRPRREDTPHADIGAPDMGDQGIPPVPPGPGQDAPHPPAGADPWGMCQAMMQALRPAAVDYSDRVAKHHPPTFPGSSDPAVLSDWAFQMTEIFELVECPRDRWVRIAVRYFTDFALQWWRARRDDAARPVPVDFDQFLGEL